jgi:hypothetical protein
MGFKRFTISMFVFFARKIALYVIRNLSGQAFTALVIFGPRWKVFEFFYNNLKIRQSNDGSQA